MKVPTIVWKSADVEVVMSLMPGDTVVGRSRECDFRLDEASVSRKHVVFRWDGESLAVLDLGSSSGTLINQQRLEPGQEVVLRPGDRLVLGHLMGVYQMNAMAGEREEAVREPFRIDEEIGGQLEHLMHQTLDRLRSGQGSPSQVADQLAPQFEVVCKEVRDRLREYRLIQEITEVLSRILNVRDLLNTALEMVADLLGADRGFILLQDPSGHLVPFAELRFNTAGPLHDWDFSGTIARNCFESGQIIILEDATEDARFSTAQSIIATKVKSVICLPLIQGENVSGVLYLDHLRRRSLFHAGQFEFLRTFARQTTLALENAKLYTQAVTDDLTGLYTRKYSETRILQELNRADRYKRPLSLLVADIDYFKKVNDQYGHLAGDQVLVRVAQIITSLIRKADLACRFGGEEFVILLPETHLKGARILAERIRSKVGREHFSINEKNFRVTISMGLAEYHTHGVQDVKSFIDVADKALYKAKQAGRNRLELAESPKMESFSSSPKAP
ncbi:MAG: diguanylate cyclase [Acidobacteria bacterium]|nr:diguanylate cyclase [Acidobacteriota bacterium]MCB9399297.1 diguanylate cyclase [Acidobacteriota bacterium]